MRLRWRTSRSDRPLTIGYGEDNGVVSLPGSRFRPAKDKENSQIVTAARKSLNIQGRLLTVPSVLWFTCLNLPAWPVRQERIGHWAQKPPEGGFCISGRLKI